MGRRVEGLSIKLRARNWYSGSLSAPDLAR